MKIGRDGKGEVDMAKCLMLLSKVGESCTNPSRETVMKGGGFKCKTCNREFHSFQALGGHRASHKKLKLMGMDLSRKLPSLKKKPKMHLCPICGLEFAIGQALGGHMRKHRATINHGLHIHDPISHGTNRFHLCLDLNLTPYENDLNLDLRTPALNSFI